MIPHKLPTSFQKSFASERGGSSIELRYWGTGETNIGYLLRISGDKALAVDVPDGRELLAMLAAEGRRLDGILLTHGHHDHVNGLEEVRDQTGCPVWVPRGLETSIAGIPVEAGASFRACGLEVRAMDTSGHSPLDFSYLLPDHHVCFCGDTLFAGGCGRMFAGPPGRLWNSLKTLRSLPDGVALCCGHDYASDNYRFATQTLPGMPMFRDMRERVEALAEKGEMLMPVTVGDQIRSNLFLMCDYPDIRGALGMADADPAEVFARLRKERDRL